VADTRDDDKRKVAGFIKQERKLLSKHALEVIGIIPDRATPSEYLMIANGLANSGLIDESNKVANEALKLSPDPDDKIFLYRFLAHNHFSAREFDLGRKYFTDALALLEDHRSNGLLPSWSYADTEIKWADWELAIGECGKARSLVLDAQERLKPIREYGSLQDADLKSLAIVVEQMNEVTKSCDPT
jgi:tetratricopeptide (TPR) repeat protein